MILRSGRVQSISRWVFAPLVLAAALVGACQTESALAPTTKDPSAMTCAEINDEIEALAKEYILVERRLAKRSSVMQGGQPNLARNRDRGSIKDEDSVFKPYEARLDSLSRQSHARKCGSAKYLNSGDRE